MNPPPPNYPPQGGYNDGFEENWFDDYPADPGTGAPNYGGNAPPSSGGSEPTSAGGNSGSHTPNISRTGGSISAGGTTGVRSGGKVAPILLDNESGLGRLGNERISDFNFPEIDILDLAKTMGKLTGKNFIVDKDVKGKVSIISNGAITVSDAWRAFLTALDMNQFTILASGKYLRIARKREAREKQIRTYTGEQAPDSDALITRIFALKYVEAQEMTQVLQRFMTPDTRIIAHQQTNTIIMTDTGSNLAKIAKMLEFLDVESYDAGIEVIAVKFASANDLANLIDKLIPGTSTGTKPGLPGAPGFGGSSGKSFASRRTKEGGIINTIFADERTNSLIIHANNKGTEQVRELVAKLDKRLPTQKAGSGKINVVYLQFAEAEKLAAALNQIASQSSTSAPKPNTPGGLGVNPQETALFEGQIRVAADVATNSLVITASPTDFSTVQQVINRLDIPREEVYCEVVIMEVEVSSSTDFQVSAGAFIPFLNNMLIMDPGKSLIGSMTDKSNLAGTGIALGFSQGAKVKIPIGTSQVEVSSVNGLVKALQSSGQGNVLATPQIMALDNQEAIFESGESIPITNTTVVPGGTAQQNTTFESAKLNITLKPQINKIFNYVKLDVTASIDDFVAIAGSSLPGKTQRKAKTNIVVGDSDTVVLGGLIRDKRLESQSKVPLLGDIPLLGWLFRSTSISTKKSNLVIFITPHIVRQYEKVRAILDKKLKERDDFIEKSIGAHDLHRDTRDAIIRSLPDPKKIATERVRRSSPMTDEDTSGDPVPTGPFGNSDEPTPSTHEAKDPPSTSLPETPGEPVEAPKPLDLDPAETGSTP